jgi:hypothetical protein
MDDDTWTERYLMPDVRYLVRYRVDPGGFYVDVEAYEIVGDYGELEAKGRQADPEARPYVFLRKGATTSSDVVDVLADAGLWLHGRIKWDGCSNLHIDAQDDGMLHFHGPDDAAAVGKLLAALYDIARAAMVGRADF